MVQVFSFEKYPSAAGVRAEPDCFVQRRRPTGVVRLQLIELIQVCLVGAHLLVGRSDFLDHSHQGLGNEPAPVHTEVTTRVRIVVGGLGDRGAGLRKLRAQDVSHHTRSTHKRLIGFNHFRACVSWTLSLIARLLLIALRALHRRRTSGPAWGKTDAYPR